MEAFTQNSFLCLKGKQLGCLNGVFEALHYPYIIDKTFEPKLVPSPGGTVCEGNTS